MAQLNFDASKVDPSVPFEAVPSDKYTAAITHSELKPTKAGDGSYFEIEYTIIEGEYKGRKVFQWPWHQVQSSKFRVQSDFLHALHFDLCTLNFALTLR